MEQSPSWEANRFSASQEIPALHGTGMFITAFTSAHYLSCQQELQYPKETPTVIQKDTKKRI